MGTSLVVYPFSGLLNLIDQKTPVVLLNMENSGIRRDNFLFIQGDLDKTV